MPDAPTVIVKNGRSQMILDVGQRLPRIGFHKTAGFGQIAGQKPAPIAEIVDQTLEQPGQERQRKTVGGAAPVSYTHLDVYKRQSPASPVL